MIGNGTFRVKRQIDGTVLVELLPGRFRVSPIHAIEMAKALIKEAGAEVVIADPGQTVIRPPKVRLAS